MRTRLAIFASLLAVLFGVILSVSVASAAGGCEISEFTMSPVDPYSLGTHVLLSGRSNCGTVRFEINGQPKAEIGSGSQTETWKTEETGSGTFSVCFVARGDGGWENANRACRSVYVEGAPPAPSGDTRGPCFVQNFTVTPSSGPVGTTFRLAGNGGCEGGTQASKFLISGSSFGESGGPNASANWNPGSSGSYEACYVITNDSWGPNTGRSCVSVNVTSSGAPSNQAASGDSVNVPGGNQGNSGSSGGGTPPVTEQSQPAAPSNGSCPDAPTRISVGDIVVANDTLKIRSGGGLGYAEIPQSPLAAGTQVTVIGGAVCSDGIRWYNVGTNGWQGYVAEIIGSNRVYLLVPNGLPLGPDANRWENGEEEATSSSCSGGRSRLQVGDIALVSDATADPLPLRSGPATSNTVLVQIPIRTQLTIIGGPVCDGRLVWWETQYAGYTGWAAEINGYNNRNLLPNGTSLPGTAEDTVPDTVPESPSPSCAGFPATEFSVGDHGQIDYPGHSDGLNLRRGPSASSDIVWADMPHGTGFTVLEGMGCADGYRWLHVRTDQGPEGYAVERNAGESFMRRIEVAVPTPQITPSSGSIFLVVTRHTIEVNPRTCAILNGAEIIRDEISYFDGSMPSRLENDWLAALYGYFEPDSGETDLIMTGVRNAVRQYVPDCTDSYYLVGDRYMDLSGLGNVMFGYYMARYPRVFEDNLSNYFQLREDGLGRRLHSFETLFDFPDDQHQRLLGRRLASLSGNSARITTELVIRTAGDVDLQ